MELVNRKPILPSDEELEDNNRSHSAKLRVARKNTQVRGIDMAARDERTRTQVL